MKATLKWQTGESMHL